MKRFVLPIIAGLLIIGFCAFAYFHSSGIAILNPAGPVALQERNVLLLTLLLSGVVVIPVFLMLFFFAWKYQAHRTEAKEQHAPNWDHDNWIAEGVWWCVPAVIIIVLGVIAWQSAHALDPWKPLKSANAPITVQVVALDWKWLFIYPDQGIATVNMLEFPENTPVHFELTADAPMNQFWIPRLGGQIMVMPGMQTQINLLASSTGTFAGKSTEISGNGFAGMNFTAKSVSQSDFTAWVESMKQGNTVLTQSVYDGLAEPSTYAPVSTYASVTPDLYTGIIMKYVMPGMSAPQSGAVTAPAAESTTSANMHDTSGTAAPL